MEILKLLEEGLSNKALASRLGIGVATVRTHLEALRRRFHAHSKLELMLRYHAWMRENHQEW